MNLAQHALKSISIKPTEKKKVNPTREKIKHELPQIKQDIELGLSALGLSEKYKISRWCLSQNLKLLLSADLVDKMIQNGKHNSSKAVSRSNTKRNKTA